MERPMTKAGVMLAFAVGCAVIRTSREVLSNTWWPVACDAGMDKALALWLNSSLGILSLVAARVHRCRRGPSSKSCSS